MIKYTDDSIVVVTEDDTGVHITRDEHPEKTSDIITNQFVRRVITIVFC